MVESIPLEQSLVVWGIVYTLMQLTVWGWVIRDCWVNRWNGKFRHTDELDTAEMDEYTYAESDFQAFVHSLYDGTVPTIEWRVTVAVPLVASGGVMIAWGVLTIVSEMVVSVL